MLISIREYWRLINRYLIPQRGAALVMALLLAGSIGLSLVAPQTLRFFIDTALSGGALTLLVRAAVGFFLIKLMQLALNILARYRVQQVAWTATNTLRNDLILHVMQLDLGFHKTHPPGELIERLDSDVEALGVFLSELVIEFIGAVLLLTGILIVIFIENADLGVLFLIYSLISLTFLSWATQFAPPHLQVDREYDAGFWGFLGEILTATEDIQSCGATRYILRRFVQYLRAWRPIQLRAALWGMIWLTTAVAYIVGIGLAWWIGGPMVRAGRLTLGTLYMMYYYLAMLVWGPIQDIQWQLTELQHAQVSINRVQELFNTTSSLENGQKTLPPGSLSVVFDDVSFAYPDNDKSPTGIQTDNPAASYNPLVLHKICFHLLPGSRLGLLGRTGSGKTTIARLLFRLYDPENGKILLGGIDVQQVKLEALRARVGLVTQDVQLFDASLRDNLTFFDASVPDEKLINTLHILGLAEWLSKLPEGLASPISNETLSAGEAQLVALARVFLKNPNLVILDEASSRIDPATESLLKKALDRLLEGRTAVIIAHHLQTVGQVDDILILEEGRSVEYGQRTKLIADPQSHFSHLLRTGIEEVLI